MLGNIVIYLNYVILVAIIVGGIALVVASSKKHEHISFDGISHIKIIYAFKFWQKKISSAILEIFYFISYSFFILSSCT